MIPFLSNGGGSSLCIQSLSNDQSIYDLPKAGDCVLIYWNMDSFVDTLIACYQEGAYYFDEEEGIWEIDSEQEVEIALRFNPGIEFWGSYCKIDLMENKLL
jgi:hypothetical protein